MLTITDAAVFDGREMLKGRHDIRIHGGRIVSIDPTATTAPAGATTNAAGATLLPGLIDGHVHFLQPEDFNELIRAGVTAASDMGTWPHGRLIALRAQAQGLSLRTAGAPLIGPSGPHSHMPGLQDSVVDSPQAARLAVSERVAEGVDHIKLVLEPEGGGGPDPVSAATAVEAAHAAGLRVVAHASAVGAIELAVEIGVDIITHAPLDGIVSDRTIARIVEERRIVIPTLIMMRMVAEIRGTPRAYANAARFVSSLHKAGATMVAGTDANSAPGAPAAVPHGTSMHNELALLVDAGLSPVEALRSATSTAASVFRWPDRGAIRPGAVADLVLVDGDPSTQISDTGRVREVWTAGHPAADAT